MIQSRCGILCDECEFKEKVDCKGCVNIDKPFYGDCAVKICCEGRKLEYCGDCSEFTCDLLKSYSYDKEHGDDGLRIAQCEIWRAENKCS